MRKNQSRCTCYECSLELQSKNDIIKRSLDKIQENVRKRDERQNKVDNANMKSQRTDLIDVIITKEDPIADDSWQNRRDLKALEDERFNVKIVSSDFIRGDHQSLRWLRYGISVEHCNTS